MTLYGLTLFVHVLSAVGLFVALAVEGVSLQQVRRATSYEQAREGASLWRLLMAIGIPSTVGTLLSGIYLATMMSAWELGWARVAVPTLVVVAVVGAVVGPRRERLRVAVAGGTGMLPADLRAKARHPLLLASWRMRTALLGGLLFEMTVKPDGLVDVLVMAGVILAGFVWSLPLWRSAPALETAKEAR